MELRGLCEACRRIRRVIVRLGMSGPGGLPVGTCDECREQKSEKE